MPLALPLALALAAPFGASFQPATARPGDPVVLVVRGAAAAPRGELAGRALEFHASGPQAWRAIAGLPLELEPGPIDVQVRAGEDGEERTAAARLVIVEPRFREQRLAVPPKFVEPQPPEVEARVEADRAAFLAAFAQPPADPLFRRPFRAPRAAPITGRFGDLRTFNGEVKGQHYGTDLKGAVGAPVLASNDGRVTLVRDAYMSGLSVVIFHGAGLHSVYFHLSDARVREGDVVRRGQRIGSVGASGRASGPHLHWGVRIGDLYVDPEAVLRLKP